MSPKFGQKMGSLKALKKTLEKGSGGGTWIKYIPKNGSKTVRFLREPEHWVNYLEHFDQVARRSFPCNGEADCPGCKGGERKSSRYLADAIEIEDSREQVIALQLPKDLANRLVVRYERNGTLLDRDFELTRSGEGLDTVYDVDALAPRKRNIAKYTPLDLEQVLEDAYNDVFGAEDDEDEVDIAPVIKKRAKSKAAAVIEDDDDDDDVDDEPKLKPAQKAAARKAKASQPEPEFEPDDEDVEDEDEDIEEDDDDEAYDEDTLRNMPLGALRAVARNEFGVNPKGMSQDEIVDAILEAGEPVDDEDGDKPPY